MQWLRDQLGIISGAAHSENLARKVDDTSGLYFVPAFSGLFAPYWRADARGAIVGLSRFHTNAHLARATLEAICYQTSDVVEAMAADSGVTLDVLKVDGGVTANDLCMQLQADILGVPVSRPVVAETTALGAAYAAGPGGRLLARHRRAARQLARIPALGALLVRRPPRGRLRRLEESGRSHPELGRRRLMSAVSRPRRDRGNGLYDARPQRNLRRAGRRRDRGAWRGSLLASGRRLPALGRHPRGLLHLTRVAHGETMTVELGEVSAAFPALGGGILTAGGHQADAAGHASRGRAGPGGRSPRRPP